MAESNKKLNSEITELQGKVADMRFDFKAGGNVDIAEFRKAKKELARLMTRRRALELGLVVDETPVKEEKEAKKTTKETKKTKETKETKEAKSKKNSKETK